MKKGLIISSVLVLGVSSLAFAAGYKPKHFKLIHLDSPAPPSFAQSNPSKVYKRKSLLSGREEFFVKDSWKGVSKKAIRMADKAIEQSGVKANISSGMRLKIWERYRQRSGNSRHTLGLAIDIDTISLSDRDKVVKALVELGAARIGIANGFVHFDLDDSLPLKYWGYSGQGGTGPAPYNPFQTFKKQNNA